MQAKDMIKQYETEWNACVHHNALYALSRKGVSKTAISLYFDANTCYLHHLKTIYEQMQTMVHDPVEKRYCEQMLFGLYADDYGAVWRRAHEMDEQPFEHPAIRNYVHFLKEQVQSECFINLLCATLPCTLSYAQIANEFPKTNHWQDDFMVSFQTVEYQALCQSSVNLLDSYLANCSCSKQTKLALIFQEGCYHERAFWDMTYELLKEEMKMEEVIMQNVATKTPLIHCITNYVTVNDCANMVLAAKGSPIMADEEAEVEDITSICNVLVINIGTLNERTIKSMIKAGKKANALGHPVILDPVGAGASALRTQTVFTLLKEVKFAVIRGNISEMKTVSMGSGTTKGVDADTADLISESTLQEHAVFVRDLAKRTGAIIVITGAIDLVGDDKEVFALRNGHPQMSRITGTGCQLTTLLAVYIAANSAQMLNACVMAVTMMGIAGEQGAMHMQVNHTGTNSLRTYIIDAISNMTYATWKEKVKYERI